MVCLLFNNKPLHYTALNIKDLGYDIVCSFSPSFSLKEKELVKVLSGNTEYDFFILKVKNNTVYSRIKLLEDLKTKKIDFSSKESISFSNVLHSLGLSSVKTRYDFIVKNFGFLGTAFEFLVRISMHYNLKFYTANNEVIFYKDIATLGTKRHEARVLEKNSVKVDLDIRSLDLVNNKRIKEVLHAVTNNLTLLTYA